MCPILQCDFKRLPLNWFDAGRLCLHSHSKPVTDHDICHVSNKFALHTRHHKQGAFQFGSLMHRLRISIPMFVRKSHNLYTAPAMPNTLFNLSHTSCAPAVNRFTLQWHCKNAPLQGQTISIRQAMMLLDHLSPKSILYLRSSDETAQHLHQALRVQGSSFGSQMSMNISVNVLMTYDVVIFVVENCHNSYEYNTCLQIQLIWRDNFLRVLQTPHQTSTPITLDAFSTEKDFWP